MDHGLGHELDVVVVGAGLAGLACGLRLAEAGVGVLVLEADDRPGGRVRTDDAGGFRVDRGFQLINPAYPALRRVLGADGMEDLSLQAFGAGAAVAVGGAHHVLGDPRRLPSAALSSLLAPLGSPWEKAAFVAWALRAATADPHALRDGADEPLSSALDRAGVRGRLRTGVVDPFLAGVLGEAEGRTSAAFARLVVRSFVLGTPGVPPDGVQRLPDLLAARLAGARAGQGGAQLRCGAPVRGIHPGADGVRVHTDDGEVRARAVVVATSGWAAADLLPGLTVPAARGLTTFWHEAPVSPVERGRARLLHLDGDRRGPVVNSALLTAVAPGYGPTGRHLVASTVLGAEPGLEPVVRQQLEHVWGVRTAGWQLVSTSVVPEALPALLPPLRARQDPALGDGVYVAGDHRDTASQQGALTSGRRAADAVLSQLGASLPAARPS
ncbi:Flavin containing amine oxidoreductase [Quadrisphaera granulorum]|uniref:Flavin-dependent amine oxidoreductase n=1 Tax=Quadrisphaera granulorum TaxID=317664 RepID=A0A315ZY82_9ACTN|nr:NAD(P)/FAD-dependent oxidoreductase [Quadrisphaera granulorum]PWJ49850.1 flavin-dependent amine oxidoreductase [Quadrisphaera granulorum]SZE98058.1 Flavin containing amine oxidoreductase [Quadrisphaera granulorum]